MSVVRVAVQCHDGGPPLKKGAKAAAAARAAQNGSRPGSRSSSPKPKVRAWWRFTLEPRQWRLPLAILCVWALLCCASYLWSGLETPFPESQRVLFVTAHPDDETIFFSPTISSLRAANKEVWLMCLSTGNAHGLGEQRRHELEKAVHALGVDAEHLVLLDDPLLQDGKNSNWSPEAIKRLVSDMQAKHNLDTIVTFDDAGITRHPNHLSVHAGVRDYISDCEAANGLNTCPFVWELVTADKAGGRKMSVLQALRQAAAGGGGGFDPRRASRAGYVNRNVLRTFAAMFEHKTQARWWAHVLTARYTMVNVYSRITGGFAALAHR